VKKPTLTSTEVYAANSRSRLEKLLKVMEPTFGFTTQSSTS